MVRQMKVGQIPRTTVLDVLVVEDICIYMDVIHMREKKHVHADKTYAPIKKIPQNIHFHHTILLSGSKRHCAKAS